MAVAMFDLRLLVSFVLLSVCLLPTQAQAGKVQYCDKETKYAVNVSGVEISPYPISRGRRTTFSISASTDEVIFGGKVQIDVLYFGINVYSKIHDLCGKTSCPVAAGDFVISHSQSLPFFTPPGSYTLQMKMEDESKHQLTCITFDFSIGFLASDEVIADS
ncbi:uncharacterized protein LOC127806279 [Diospyros lotus]|uniref:uncharacterized protein LOC127806279 n=1 Tax=Diospyros lotus TaxID=55363 RepID=UPI0022568020|nr:uncharacterized protein LOC127806279 [Diospyros lotus]XP_052199437.1 uncharacterized protein LOC127806279 [Diospyros lotus]